jgi:hypothetical protein
MWLPRHERLILAGLFHNIADGRDEAFHKSDLARCFSSYRKRRIPEYGDDDAGKNLDDDADPKEQIATYIGHERRVNLAVRQLAARGLLTLSFHSGEPSVMVVALTLPGNDLGRKYANWFDRSGLWFREYKDHWLWLLVAFIGGGFVGGFISNLADRLFEK